MEDLEFKDVVFNDLESGISDWKHFQLKNVELKDLKCNAFGVQDFGIQKNGSSSLSRLWTWI